MEVDPSSPTGPQPYTILRIKRKRNEEPLEGLGTLSVRVVRPSAPRERRAKKKRSDRVYVAQKEAWRAGCVPVCRNRGARGVG